MTKDLARPRWFNRSHFKAKKTKKSKSGVSFRNFIKGFKQQKYGLWEDYLKEKQQQSQRQRNKLYKKTTKLGLNFRVEIHQAVISQFSLYKEEFFKGKLYERLSKLGEF